MIEIVNPVNGNRNSTLRENHTNGREKKREDNCSGSYCIDGSATLQPISRTRERDGIDL